MNDEEGRAEVRYRNAVTMNAEIMRLRLDYDQRIDKLERQVQTLAADLAQMRQTFGLAIASVRGPGATS